MRKRTKVICLAVWLTADAGCSHYALAGSMRSPAMTSAGVPSSAFTAGVEQYARLAMVDGTRIPRQHKDPVVGHAPAVDGVLEIREAGSEEIWAPPGKAAHVARRSD